MSVLRVRDLSVRFETRGARVQAVDRISFELEAGETLGLVGESGSGKTVACLALLGLVPSPPGVVDAGAVELDGRDLRSLSERELCRLRGDRISMIFQDPLSALHPLLTIERQMSEVLEVHRGMNRRAARRQCARALADVGIPAPEERLSAYPHELSGGMRQRVMIAMALLCNPAVLIADEPTTALDVTIQAQILELLATLQEQHGTAIVLISHDLGVVAGEADRVHVMYAGRIVEKAATEDLYARPLHPYTAALLASVPSLEGDPRAALFSIPGQPPDLARLPTGCAFAPRCTRVHDACRRAVPTLVDLRPSERRARASACIDAAALLGELHEAAR